MIKGDALRQIVQEEFVDHRKLSELIFGIKVHSKAKVSRWLHHDYDNCKELERDIARFILSRRITRGDERILFDIRHLLNSAINPQAIISRLAADTEDSDG
jgi:hypothetical protein